MVKRDVGVNGRKRRSRACAVLISDHPVTRIGLENCFRNAAYGACYIASTARKALQLIDRLKPELIIIDVSSPSENHISHIKDIHAVFPAIPILTFSNRKESLYAERALRLGAKGYITESGGKEQLRTAVNRLLEGRLFIPDDAAEKMLLGMTSAKCLPRSPLHLLSERELQIFEMIGEGQSISEVSNALGISRKTVGTHRCHIGQKLGTRSAYGLLEYAFRWVQAQNH